MRKWASFVLVAIVFAAHVSSLRGGTVWDDEFLTTRNPYLGWDGLSHLVSHDLWIASAKEESSGYYRPLAALTFALNRWLLGNDALSYHLGNVLVHCAVVFVLYRLLRHVSSRKTLPFVLALAFGVSPVTSEAVCWLAGRFDALATLMVVLAFTFHVQRRLGWTLLAYTAALFCKETVITLPVVLFLVDVTRKGRQRRDFLLYPVLALVTGGYFVVRAACHVSSAATNALATPEALRGYAHCVKLALGVMSGVTAPSIFHMYRDEGWTTTALVFLALAIVSLVLLRASYRRKSWITFIAWMWILVALVPVGLTAPRLFQTGDRYFYLPLLALTVAIAGLDALLLRRAGDLYIAVGIVVALVAGLRIPALLARTDDWQNEETLYSRELARDKNRYWAAELLGERRAREGKYAEAEALLTTARAQSPSPWRIHIALCYVYLNEHRSEEALLSCNAGLAVNPNDPRGLVNRAHVRLSLGHPRKAADDASHAIMVKPHYAEGYFARALALHMMGDDQRARVDLAQALAFEPGHRGAADLLATLGGP